jgi:hypothetical protein
MNQVPDTCKPSVEEVEKYLDLWNRLENYVNQERALDKLFMELYPNNKSLELGLQGDYAEDNDDDV